MTLLTFASLLFGTFVSEDLACVTAGLLIERGELAASTGILACTLGIFVGDLGLWAAGRLFGHAVLRHLPKPSSRDVKQGVPVWALEAVLAAAAKRSPSEDSPRLLVSRSFTVWPWIGRQLQQARATELRQWLERHAAGAIVASRFLPGTRLPLYLVAGILKLPVGVFAAWALLGTLLWTPALVLVTARLGDAWAVPVSPLAGIGLVSHVLIPRWGSSRSCMWSAALV